ncbi:MAG: DUF3298 and DUF4163 domain-containing protein [Armatimonadetes bacterium]|nr:DUF3298 and DUF4163 domain-containing protein [Armatimonadota bacterium]
MRYVPLVLLLASVPAAAFAAPLKPATLAIQYKTLTGKKVNRYEYRVKYPVFSETGSPVARLANASLRAYAVKEVADFLKYEAESWREYRAKEVREVPIYDLDITPIVSVARPDLISVHFGQYSYQGGAHPNTWYPSQSFGVISGTAKKLTLSDLFAPGTDPYKPLSTIAIPELKKRGASSVTGEKPEITTLTPTVLRNWTLTPSGITLLFSPYEVASYAEGAFVVKCSWSELEKTAGLSSVIKPLREK